MAAPTDTQTLAFSGIDLTELAAALERGVDPAGNPIESFVDEDGGWPMRCCLRDSSPGDRIAIISWTPFPWTGPYAETGPIVVHATPGCSPSTADTLPADLDQRPMVLRPYGHDRRIAYHRVRHVAADQGVAEQAAALLELDDVDFVHGRNLTGGCYAFTARRVP
ncbi:MAG: DUF1203 domain-containing protein [Actinomycetota bacterium]